MKGTFGLPFTLIIEEVHSMSADEILEKLK